MVRAACFVVGLTVALAVLATVLREDAGDAGSNSREYTAGEKAAAAVALRFANLDYRRDAVRACALVAGDDLRRTMRCGSRLARQSGELEIPVDRPFEVYSIAPVNNRGITRVFITPGNPVLEIAVDASGKVQSVGHYATA